MNRDELNTLIENKLARMLKPAGLVASGEVNPPKAQRILKNVTIRLEKSHKQRALTGLQFAKNNPTQVNAAIASLKTEIDDLDAELEDEA